MANRQLTQDELAMFRPILDEVRTRLRDASRGDHRLLWALRRKLYKELTYDERGKPMFRRQLKTLKRVKQGGKCALCPEPLPEKNAVLDRIEAMLGYTSDNTRLLCPQCDNKVQVERGFA
jgi:ribosomal protein L44E